MLDMNEKVYDNISLPNYHEAQKLPKDLNGLF